ncbi:hypothetical protein JCM10207_000284 [Rhodosporidiobolus poonsookiae]
MDTSLQHRMGDVWPEGKEYLRPIVTSVYMLLLCLLAILLSSRIGSPSQILRMGIMQGLVCILLGASLLFVAASVLIVLGLGSSYSAASCEAGIFLCVFLYAGTKAVLYGFLLEKLYIVHSHTYSGRIRRLQSWWYRGGLFLWTAWLGTAIAMIVGRIAFIRQGDGQCVIGLKLYATVPMLTVDSITNIFLTTGFVLPIYRSSMVKTQRLARNSAIAAIAALITSFANILILSLEHGHQLSFVCLGSCGLDVAFNSITVYIVTSPTREISLRSSEDADPRQSNKGGTATIGGTGASRLYRSETRFPSPRTNTFRSAGHGAGVGITITEEVQIDDDRDSDDIPLPELRKMQPHPPARPVTAVSFVDMGDGDEKSFPEDEKRELPDSHYVLPE